MSYIMFTAPLYTYLVDLNISWTFILPYYTIPLYWKRAILFDKASQFGCLVVSLLSVPQVCIIKFHGAWRRGRAKQNKKVRTGKGAWKLHIAMVAVEIH